MLTQDAVVVTASDFLLLGQQEPHFVHVVFLQPDISQEQSWAQAWLMTVILPLLSIRLGQSGWSGSVVRGWGPFWYNSSVALLTE